MKFESSNLNGSDFDLNQVLSSILDIGTTMKESRKDLLRNYGKNVAELGEGAHVSKGPTNCNAMLRADWCKYDVNTGHTGHMMNQGFIQVNLRMLLRLIPSNYYSGMVIIGIMDFAWRFQLMGKLGKQSATILLKIAFLGKPSHLMKRL